MHYTSAERVAQVALHILALNESSHNGCGAEFIALFEALRGDGQDVSGLRECSRATRSRRRRIMQQGLRAGHAPRQDAVFCVDALQRVEGAVRLLRRQGADFLAHHDCDKATAHG